MSSGIRNTSGARIQISLGPQSLARVLKKSSARCRHLELDLIIRLMITCGAHADFIFIWFFFFAHKGQTATTPRIPDSRGGVPRLRSRLTLETKGLQSLTTTIT